MTQAQPAWTVRKVVRWVSDDLETRAFDSPKLDAELLVGHALEMDRMRVYLELDRPLLPSELKKVRALVQRRREGEPVAYLLGAKEFYGLSFVVTPDVLVPRPDTETLVERALQLPSDPIDVLDLCTGSGALAVVLAHEREPWRVTATDISDGALQVASRNADKHGVAERVTFRQGDLFTALDSGSRFDLIVSNPPYVSVGEYATLSADVHFEPEIALVGGEDGLAFYRKILEQAPLYLNPGGRLLLEIGSTQAQAVKELVGEGLAWIKTHSDLAGRDRVVEVATNNQ